MMKVAILLCVGRFVMSRCLLLILFAAVCALPIMGQAADKTDVSGTWAFQVETPAGSGREL